MKIAVIGGGGVRSMFLSKALVQRAKQLGITEIVFMDTDETKLRVYGELARQAAKRIDGDVCFRLTLDAREAIGDADYVITTIRAGGDDMRVADERAALNEGRIGQETTGAAGFSFAMRSLPALIGYCDMVKSIAHKGCKVFNFTNPAGLVSQALRGLGYDFAFGVCDAPSGFLRSVERLCGAKEGEVNGRCYGLNHLSFFSSITLKGEEILPRLMADERFFQQTDMRFFEPALARRINRALNEYLYYYYYPDRALKNILDAPETRGELIARVNRGMTQALLQIDIEKDFDLALQTFCLWHGKRTSQYMASETGETRPVKPYSFDLYSRAAGGYAGVALRYIEAVREQKPVDMILCVPNRGAMPFLRPDDVAELTCRIEPDGEYTPYRVDDPGEMPMQLIKAIKAYERKAAQALTTHDPNGAKDALYLNPLVGDYDVAERLTKAYIRQNSTYDGAWTV